MRIQPQEKKTSILLFLAEICFALTIITAPFRWRVNLWSRPIFPIYSDYTNYLLFASDIFMLSMLVLWAASLILVPRKIKIGSPLIFWSLVGLTIAGFVSVLNGEDAVLSRYHAARLVPLLFFFLFIINEIKSAKWILIPVALQLLIQAIVIMIQVDQQNSLGWTSLGELSLDPNDSGVSVIFGDGFRFLRGYGLSDHPNIVGGCITFGLVLLLAVVLHGKRNQAIAASVVFLPSLLALVMTFSRAAWLSFVLVACFFLGTESLSRRWEPVKRGILLGILSLLVIYPFVKENGHLFKTRINSGDVNSDSPMIERAFLLESGNTLFVEHPAIGVGIGAAPLAMKNRFENFPVNFQPPHYAILTVALETGVPGGTFYLLLLSLPLISFLFRYEALSQQPVVGVFGLLLAISIIGLFDYYTWSYPYGRIWQWLGWGMWSVTLERSA